MKQLEFIQTAIGRMSNQSATLKNYSMTGIVAFVGLAAATKTPSLLGYALPLLAVFASLDARYLAIERVLRKHFDEVRIRALTSQPDFEVLPNDLMGLSWWRALKSWAVAGFYIPIAVAMIVIIAFMR